MRRRQPDLDLRDLCIAIARSLIGLGRNYAGLIDAGLDDVVGFDQLTEWTPDQLNELIGRIEEAQASRLPALRGGFDLIGLRLLAGQPVVLPNWLIGAHLETMPLLPIRSYRLSLDTLEPA